MTEDDNRKWCWALEPEGPFSSQTYATKTEALSALKGHAYKDPDDHDIGYLGRGLEGNALVQAAVDEGVVELDMDELLEGVGEAMEQLAGEACQNWTPEDDDTLKQAMLQRVRQVVVELIHLNAPPDFYGVDEVEEVEL